MNQDQVVNSVIKSIQKVNDNSFTNEQLNIIGSYFYMVYAVGFDEGRQQISHRKAVVIYKNGVRICEKDSAVSAGRYVGISKGAVSKAIKNGTITKKGNFTFKYK